MDTSKFEQVPVDKLVPYARNARTHSKQQIAQLRASIREFGFVSPAVIDSDYNILVGHGRVQAAREEGYKTIPCVFAENLTEAQKRAYILADNQLALNAGWDEDMLSVELEDLKNDNFDLSLLGFDDTDLDKYLSKDEEDVSDDDFDLSAALEKATFVQSGDLWTVGRHKLLCGDATKAEDVAKLMGDQKANLIVTDPPYGVSFKASDGLTIQNDSIKGDDFYKFLLASFSNMKDHLEAGGAAYIFHADLERMNFQRAFTDVGFHLSGVCIWVKNSLVLGGSDYQWQHESVLYGFLQNGKHYWSSAAGRSQTTVWNFDKPKRNKNHPTSKPLDLISYPIKNSSQENAIVLDTFGGSGSTLMACEKTNRICRTMELDPKYASVILRRYVEDTSDQCVFVERNGQRFEYKDLVKEVETLGGGMRDAR